MIVAMQIAERKVSRRGKGMLTPKNSRRPAYLHHFIAVMKPSIKTTVAITDAGSKTAPDTGTPVRSPFDRAFVRPL